MAVDRGRKSIPHHYTQNTSLLLPGPKLNKKGIAPNPRRATRCPLFPHNACCCSTFDRRDYQWRRNCAKTFCTASRWPLVEGWFSLPHTTECCLLLLSLGGLWWAASDPVRPMSVTFASIEPPEHTSLCVRHSIMTPSRPNSN
jgi:hypothetical protein